MSFEEKNFEDQLRQAMRREPAPAYFAARVTGRALAQTHVRWRGPAVVAVAAMLALAVLIPVAEHRQAERAEAAKNQTLQALAITNAQLQHVMEKIQRSR